MKLYEIVIFKIEKESLENNWLNNNENQGFDYSCFKRLIGSGWTGDIGRLRNALNAIGLLRSDSDIESFLFPLCFLMYVKEN